MFYKNHKLLIRNVVLMFAFLGGMIGVTNAKASSEATPQVNIFTPPYPIGMDSGERKLVPYRLTESGNASGEFTSRTIRFYTQYDVPLSDFMGPYVTNISVYPLQTNEWNEPVYLPEEVVNKARDLEEYAIVLKTTFTGKSASGADFSSQSSLLLLLPPDEFGKVSPSNSATGQPTNPSLQWNSSVGAIDYEYCFDTINNNSCDTNWNGTYDTNAVLQNLPLGTTFYWQVRANNMAGTTYANNGVWWSFTTEASGPTLPGAATLVSPDGDIGTSFTPTYIWNKVSGATWYYLWVNSPSGNVIKQWVQASAVCSSSTCSATPAKSLSVGNHTWWIQTWNEVGYGPWSAGMTFSTTAPIPPGVATLVSPTGAIGDKTPTYTWDKASGATWYYLWVKRPSGDPIKLWYDAAVVCGANTCSVTPTTTLGAGNHTFWVQTWNPGGYGPWSAGMSFNVSPPGVATLVSPSGSIGNSTPTYTWNQVNDATWYYLWINGPSGNVIKQWYGTAQANCNGMTCSVTPGNTLSGGTYTWWVQTWNPVGYGPWSSAQNFNVP